MSKAVADSAPVYQARLAEIFASCDSGDKGYLSLFQLERLCRQLHLQSHKQCFYNDLHVEHTGNTKVYLGHSRQPWCVSCERWDLTLWQRANRESALSQTTVSLESSGRRDSADTDADHRLHLPADMMEDDSEFVVSEEKGAHSSQM